jgi:hypothetical protein
MSTMAYVCRTGPPAFVAWRAGTTNPMPESTTVYPHSQGLRIWLLNKLGAGRLSLNGKKSIQ